MFYTEVLTIEDINHKTVLVPDYTSNILFVKIILMLFTIGCVVYMLNDLIRIRHSRNSSAYNIIHTSSTS